MKPILTVCIASVLSLFLCGCPYESPYNIDEPALQNIDESLVGKWSGFCGSTAREPGASQVDQVSVCFEKRTGMDYDIIITGYLERLKPYHLINNDTIRGTGYLSIAAGKQFLNAYINGKVYLAEVIRDSSSVSLLPLAEYFTSKLVKNSSELRKAVEFHYKVARTPGYDPQFSLWNLHRAASAASLSLPQQ